VSRAEHCTITITIGLVPEVRDAVKLYVSTELDAERRQRRDMTRRAFDARELLGFVAQLDELARGQEADKRDEASSGIIPRLSERRRPLSLITTELVPLSVWCRGYSMPLATARRHAASGLLPGACQLAGRWLVPASTTPPQQWLERRQQ